MPHQERSKKIMNIYYVGSFNNFDNHKEAYAATTKSIVKTDNKLTNQWFSESSAYANNNNTSKDSARFYESTMEEIEKSDIIIIDTTVSSMSTGYQSSYAINRQKPTLLLVDTKHRNPSELFMAKSNSPNLQISGYDSISEIDNIIKKFIQKHNLREKKRLNLVLEKKQFAYLTWAAFTKKQTITFIIKTLINKSIETDDDYKAFHNNQK